MVDAELRARTVNVYLPSQDTKERWEAHADDHDRSVSQWVQDAVQNHLAQQEMYAEERDLAEQLDEAQSRIDELEHEVELRDARIEQLEDRVEALDPMTAWDGPEEFLALRDEVEAELREADGPLGLAELAQQGRLLEGAWEWNLAALGAALEHGLTDPESDIERAHPGWTA